MRITHVALSILLLAFAAPAPFGAAPVASAANCSPIPHVVAVDCAPVPTLGGVALFHVPGFGVQMRSTAGFVCTAPAVTATSATTTCSHAVAALTLCADPHAIGLITGGSALTATAQCRGGAPATCQTGSAPGSFCFSPLTVLNAGTFALTCSAEVAAPANLLDGGWWVECAQPV